MLVHSWCQFFRQIDEELRRLMDAAYQKCEQILSANREKLLEVSEYLLKNEIFRGRHVVIVNSESPELEIYAFYIWGNSQKD